MTVTVKVPSIKELADNALYFGHKTSHWNPKFKKFIFGEKGGVHVINLNKTQEKLKTALEFLATEAEKGKELLVVGTKTQARSTILGLKGSNIHYVATKWLPGLITNFKTVKKRIAYYNRLIEMRSTGEMQKYSKKEISEFSKDIKKLETMIGGVLGLTKVPDVVLLVDIHKEKTALKEAKNLGIKTVGIVDTNSDPTQVDFPIPANDDSKKGLDFLVNLIKTTWESNSRKVSQSKEKVNKPKEDKIESNEETK